MDEQPKKTLKISLFRGTYRGSSLVGRRRVQFSSDPAFNYPLFKGIK